ncbi:MAG TPA: hypothetical protein VF832_15330 [Longimicrobiales bacterium]
MKSTTAVALVAMVLALGACKKSNNTNTMEETSPAAAPAPAPAPAMAPESAATATPAMTTPATPADTSMSGMKMGTDTGKMGKHEKEKKGKK